MPELRVLDAEGEMLGVLSRADALQKAKDAGVDLVEISPNARPPLCKIIDYGKMLYELKKKEQKAKLANKKKEQKGVRLTFKIDVGDLERQRKLAEKFLVDGHAVRVQMRLRGRERAHMPMALQKMRDFLKSLDEISKIDSAPNGSGGQVVAIISPSKGAKK